MFLVVVISLPALLPPSTAVASGRAAFLVANGIPGSVIDVCSDGREIASSLHYGDSVQTRLPTLGRHVFQAREAATGTCQGKRIARLRERIFTRGAFSLVAGLDQLGNDVLDLSWLGKSHPLRPGRFQIVLCHLAYGPRLHTYVDGGPFVRVANDETSYCWDINRIPPGRHSLSATIARNEHPAVPPTEYRFRAGWKYAVWIVGSKASGYSFLIQSFDVGSR